MAAAAVGIRDDGNAEAIGLEGAPGGVDEAAVLVDERLRRLSGQEARCRVLLGRVARVFLRTRAHQALGFARLSDYARERLGYSGREVQSLARVAERLRSLPLIAAAFARGELCWTRLRDLVELATPEDEDGWFELIHGPGARIAEVAARRRRRGRGEDDYQAIDGEPAVTVRLECPRQVRAQWRRVVELARRVCGSDIPIWQVADAIAGEGFSARGMEADASAAGDDCHIGSRPPSPLGPPDVPPGATLPDDLSGLEDGCERLDAFGLDHRLRRVVRALQQIDWQTGRLLQQLSARGLHRRLGYLALHHYVASRLAISPRKARALITLERRSREAPILAEVYREGQLSWLRVLTLLPVARGGVAQAWVARARSVTLRRLADEVDWALTMRDTGLPGIDIPPPPADAALVRPDGQIGARDGREIGDVAIVFPAPASVATLLRETIASFAERGDPAWGGLERLLTHVEKTWKALPRHRDPIFERDGWRCAVPACSSRRELHDHHVVFRSEGGENTQDNRVTVCAAHHLHGLHEGRVRARGRAPDGIVWELGVRSGWPPLLRLQGDRYLD